MGCGNTKLINQEQLSNSSPLAGDRKRKSVGVQTSQTHILDLQDSETQGRTKLKRNDSAAIVNPKQSSNPPLRRSTMMHDSSRALKKKSSFFHQHETDQQQQQQIHLQSLLVKQSSSHSQEYDSPLEVRRKFSSESKIDLGSSAQGVNQFASSIQNSINALNSPSIENQTANFFKNSGEQDILSSREYTNVLTNTINNIVEYNSSSPRIVSNAILPPESDQNSLGQHQYVERQQNRVPTLSKPPYAQFTGFSQDYILVGQNSSEQAIGNNQYAKKLSEIHEEKELNLQKIGITGERRSSIFLDSEGKVITNNNLTSQEQAAPPNGFPHGNEIQQSTELANQFNNSVISLKDQNISQVAPSSTAPLKMAKVPIQQTFNQIQQISTDHLNNGEDSLVHADNRKQSNLLEESYSTPVLGDNKKQNENSVSTGISNTNNNNTNTNGNMAKTNNVVSNNTNGNNIATSTAVKDSNSVETKKQGSFRIKTKQSLSTHASIEQQQQPWLKKIGTNEQQQQQHLEKKNSNLGKGNGEIIFSQTNSKNGITQNPQLVATTYPKRQVNLIDLVKNQQSQQTLTGLSRHSLKSPQLNPSKVLSVKGNNDLMLRSTHEDFNTQKQPRKASRIQQPTHQTQQQRSLQREKSGNTITVSKYLSPKTNLIEFVQSISMKGLQPTNSLSSHNLFQGQVPPSGQNVVYDQNLEIDGLSPISSNINPNFRASYDYDDDGVEYEEAEGEENGAFMNDKSHTNIASFPNLHNNSSSFSGHKDNETYSNEASQTICPSVINGWELADNSRLDFDKYEFDIQAADALRASTRQASMRVLNSQLLPSFLTQQPSQSNINSSNVLQHPSLQQSQYQHMHQSIHQSQINSNGQQRVFKQQQQTTQIGSSSVHRSNSSQPMQPQSSSTNRSSKRLTNLKKGDSNSNNIIMNHKKEDLPNPTFKKVLSEADSSSQQDSSPKGQTLPESRLPVQQPGEDKINGQSQKQQGNQPQVSDTVNNNNGDDKNQKKKTNSSSRSIPQIPKGATNQANSIANSNTNTNSVSVVNNSNNTNESKVSINTNTIKDGKTSARSGGEQVGSPSRSPNHLSPQYLTDMRFVRGSNRKTTMEIKDIIRKRSDSSNSQNTNESILSQGESQKHSRENGKSIPSQFSGQESQESQRVGRHQQIHNSSRHNSSSSSSSPKKLHHVRGSSKSSTQRKHSQKKKTITSNQKIEIDTNQAKDQGSSNTSEPSLAMKSNPKLGNSTRVNLIEFTKQNQQQQLTQQFQISETSLVSSQQKIPSNSEDTNNPTLTIQIAEERKIDRKKLSTNAANNQNLLNSLYNISEEPNEQNTEIHSRSHFDFPSSQIAIEQGNNVNRPSMNQINNSSINPSQRQITTNSSAGQNLLASPSKNQQEIPIFPQPVPSASFNRAATQKTSIVTPNSNSVSQNNSKQGFGDISNKSQNLLDILSNRNNNNNSDNSEKYPSSGLQNIPSITNTTDNRISLRSTPAPNSIQVLSHGPSGSLFPSQISAATASDFNNGQTNNYPLQSSSTSIKTAEVFEKKTNNTSNNNIAIPRKSLTENGSKGEDKKSAPILPQAGEKKKETSPKKTQQITSITSSQRQKTMLSQSTAQQNPQQMEKSSNNLSVNASTPHGSSQSPAAMTQSKSPSKREKFSKLSKANTTTISKTLSYSMLQEQHSVLETTKLDKSVNADGQKQINNYIVLKSVGKGSFGKVKQVIDTHSKKYYAVKIINRDKLKKRKLDRTKSAYSLIEKEVAILKRMAHPNIVKLYEVIDDQDEAKIYLVMDLLKKGSINSKAYWKVEKGKAYKEDEKYKISEEKLKKYFRDFLLGLDYLHNFANVVHRDIKPDNLLIGDMDELKIGDFGVSQMFEGNNDEFTNDNGTKCYLAPEIFKTHEFSGRPLDIWAAGICFYELLTGDRPFQGKVLEDLKKSILEKELQFPENMSEDLKEMFRKCLDKDPKKRATVTDLSNDDWVTDKGQNPLDFEVREGDIHDINDEELKNAFTKSFLSQRVNITAKLKANLNKTRSNIEKKKSFLNEDDNTLNVNKY